MPFLCIKIRHSPCYLPKVQRAIWSTSENHRVGVPHGFDEARGKQQNVRQAEAYCTKIHEVIKHIDRDLMHSLSQIKKTAL